MSGLHPALPKSTPAFSATRPFPIGHGLVAVTGLLTEQPQQSSTLELIFMTVAALYAPLTNAALELAARVKATWAQGPVPCWFDYLHDTDNKA